jgi:hypothetical protein
MDPIIIIHPDIVLRIIQYIIIVLLEIYLLIHLVVYLRTGRSEEDMEHYYPPYYFFRNHYLKHIIIVLFGMAFIPIAILYPLGHTGRTYFIPHLLFLIIIFIVIFIEDYYFNKLISYLKKKFSIKLFNKR